MHALLATVHSSPQNATEMYRHFVTALTSIEYLVCCHLGYADVIDMYLISDPAPGGLVPRGRPGNATACQQLPHVVRTRQDPAHAHPGAQSSWQSAAREGPLL